MERDLHKGLFLSVKNLPVVMIVGVRDVATVLLESDLTTETINSF